MCHVSHVNCHLLHVLCHRSLDTCHMSLASTATAMTLPLLTPPLCSVGWFANTQKQDFLRTQKTIDKLHIFCFLPTTQY
jgi:hypothetical protein